jgi:hypothetical protein
MGAFVLLQSNMCESELKFHSFPINRSRSNEFESELKGAQ